MQIWFPEKYDLLLRTIFPTKVAGIDVHTNET